MLDMTTDGYIIFYSCYSCDINTVSALVLVHLTANRLG